MSWAGAPGARRDAWIREHPMLVAGSLAVLAAVVVVGLTVRFGFGRSLGSALSPFVMGYRPALAWPMAVAVALAAAVVGVTPRALRAPAPSFAAGLLGVALALALAINAGRSGSGDWSAIYRLGRGGSFEAINEYLPGLPALSYGTRFFLDRFAELVPTLPVHVAGHPPGLLVAVHLAGLTTPGRLAAVCIVCAAAVAPLTYALGRVLLDEAEARIAGLLAAVCPCMLLFGTTSADAVYAAFAAGIAVLLAIRSWRVRAAGAVLLGIGTLFSWSLLAVGAWAVIVAWRREGVERALALAASSAAGVALVLGLVVSLHGYDPVGALAATDSAYRASLARLRPYWFWVVGSPTAWALAVGPPIVLAAIVGVRRLSTAALAVAVVVAIASVGGYTKAETERIWLIFVPLVCVAAAEAGLAARHPRATVALLLTETVLAQALFYTVW